MGTKNIEHFLNTAWTRIHVAALCHYATANKYAALRMRLGIPSIILLAVAGASVGTDAPGLVQIVDDYGNPEGYGPLIVRLVMLAIVLSAGTLASLMTFLDYETRRSKHHETGLAYSALLRRIESVRIESNVEHDKLDDISEEEQKILLASPSIPSRIFRKVMIQTKTE